MSATKLLGIVFILAVVILGSLSMFTVDEREKAIMFRLGEIVRTDFEPGLHWQYPIFNNVRKFDSRIQTLDAEPERYLTSEKKNVIVDAFVKWKINDVSTFFTATRGDINEANSRLSQVIKDSLRGEFGKRTIQEVISGERNQIMDILTKEGTELGAAYGISIIDVRIKRIDLPPRVSDSVYDRMKAERTRVANELRAKGDEAAERIRANADKERTIIVAEAFQKAETLRGEGDGTAANIYAKAYNKDKEFYAFYRSLGAYKESFANKQDILVVQPNTEFFKYFK